LRKLRRCCACAVALWLAAGATGHAAETQYPQRAVRFIVPYAAGGAADVTGRLVAQKLADLWRQQVVIDNRGGANGQIGCELAAKAPADGYTWLMATSSTHGSNVGFSDKLTYDPVKDFDAVTQLVSIPSVLSVHPSVPARNVAELIRLAKSKPGQLTFGSGGTAGVPHLAGELFMAMAGVDMIHIPYKSGNQSTVALLSGDVAMTFNTLVTSVPYIKLAKLRPLGVTSLKRSALLPDVPTISEAGLKGYEIITWYGIALPAGAPKAVIDKIYLDTVKVLAQKDVAGVFESLGADAVGNTPAEFGRMIQAGIPKWVKLVKSMRAPAGG
jgi:tripartite-type tricarboxylate transporter receptor subunit TctC